MKLNEYLTTKEPEPKIDWDVASPLTVEELIEIQEFLYDVYRESFGPNKMYIYCYHTFEYDTETIYNYKGRTIDRYLNEFLEILNFTEAEIDWLNIKCSEFAYVIKF